MPEPRWMDDDAKTSHAKKTVRFGRRREKALVAAIGGQAVARSGAGRTKGDSRKGKTQRIKPREEYHVEIKATRNKSFSITRKLIDKLYQEAGYARTPLFVVELNDRARPQAFVVMPLDEFQRLTGEKITL